VRRSLGASKLEQRISLSAGQRRVDFAVEVDWYEREKFLKAAFDIDVHSQRAAYETQFGHHFRATHENTSWEAAKFEVCAHRWVHVEEPGYGVALANDSTYGHDVRRNERHGGSTSTTLRLSLLRAPRFPDPDTDQGTHAMRYALAPGATIADAVAAGYAINLPARAVEGAAQVDPIVHVDGDGVVVEAVKLADDRSGDVVVRFYEALGGRAAARVTPSFGWSAVSEVDLLERELTPDATAGQGDEPDPEVVHLSLRPFQIATLRFRPGPTKG
jgi:alpha-mannosidase